MRADGVSRGRNGLSRPAMPGWPLLAGMADNPCIAAIPALRRPDAPQIRDLGQSLRAPLRRRRRAGDGGAARRRRCGGDLHQDRDARRPGGSLRPGASRLRRRARPTGNGRSTSTRRRPAMPMSRLISPARPSSTRTCGWSRSRIDRAGISSTIGCEWCAALWPGEAVVRRPVEPHYLASCAIDGGGRSALCLCGGSGCQPRIASMKKKPTT